MHGRILGMGAVLLLGASLGAAGLGWPLPTPVTHGGPAPQAWVNTVHAMPTFESSLVLRNVPTEEAGSAAALLPAPALAPTPESHGGPTAEAGPAQDAAPRPTPDATPRPALKSYPLPGVEHPSAKAAPPLASAAHPDFAALGGLLDQLSKDQASLRQLLAQSPTGLAGLNAEQQLQVQALLKRQDATEALLQERLKTDPIPLPAATPSSAKPYATSTPLP